MLEVFELKCSIQKYYWGKKGMESEVSRLSLAGGHIDSVDEQQTYAELWMGTLDKGMAKVKANGQDLKCWLDVNLEALGDASRAKFGNNLPFLLKVLSINSALSIQVHPDKECAAKLHKKFPELYQDSNHKPEIAIALSDFEALCGFRPYTEIKIFLEEIPEFKVIIGSDLIDQFKKNNSDDQTLIKHIFYKLMTTDKDIIKQSIIYHKNKLKELEIAQKEIYLEKLFCQLDCWYPGDVGCFCIYFLNYIKLSPGQAIYLDANVPHAYINGDCIECMACSDNVIRAGLTTKFIDVKTLCETMNYNGAPAESKLFYGVRENVCTTLFKPPVLDFAVAYIEIPPNTTYDITVRHVASIVLVFHGECTVNGPSSHFIFSKGKVIFIPANVPVKIIAGSEIVCIYQAFANV
ncbi:mannose-6-phosphate isomerase isoform X2 [Adelges cooleyi]|uniref:mannose-6-phosphate isomerase isoform X2 n=1 Tax=Adelges cooleyi TaxID=133065 RepID=UPI002180153E|nr:mannose-6-phosphate isomerase isoform X2 [Adelges cooleyi]